MTTFRHNYIYLLIGLLAFLPLTASAAGLSFPKRGSVNHSGAGISFSNTFTPKNTSVVNESYDSEKSKKITRTIKVSSKDKLQLENRYGKVHINTWDKNEVSVNIDIIARASSDERAAEILNTIDVEIDEDISDNLISFKTQFNKGNKIKNWGNNTGFEINYTVSMPRQNPLDARNMYGDLYLADYTGNASISLSYGNLKLGKLSGENDIRLAYGTGSNSIAGIKKGSLDLSYSKLSLGETDALDLKNSYSDINIEKAGAVNLSSRYGSVDIKAVNSLEGSSGYSGFSIGSLANKIDLDLEYCNSFRIDEISPKFNSIDLDGSYSTLNLNFSDNTAFTFDVNVQYGDLRVDKELVQFKVVEKKNTSSKYQGKFGKASSASQVRISSRYGDIKFAHQ